MNEKPTYELDRILNKVEPESFDQFRTSENTDTALSLSDFFMNYMGTHNLLLKDVIKRSDIPSNYAYGLLNGNKIRPSRDRVIALCLACRMNLTDTNRALKIAGLSPLYSKISRDAAIIIMINKCEFDVGIINEFLYGHNLDILNTSSTQEKTF
ncbi:MAG: hypothetical protein SO361_03540 [Lachnospira sp.]|nr:hypothetical protein [Lachnospira sp.]